jgi:UDP-N-acetylmuramoyl-tripeptide--D-alanyl-D-alanine ligase
VSGAGEAGFWTLDRVAAALADYAVGKLPRGSESFSGITTDTRKIGKGNVFVALKGERFDGHDYLSDAVRDGAAAVVVSKAPKLNTLDVPVFEVRDTLVALRALANYWRRAWGKTVIGVAGSNGKTSTKDLIKAALSRSFAIHATTGNLNNRIGVPLSLLSIPAEAELAVIELGTSLPGEVALLRAIAEPDIALVTSIAEEHLEGLGDLAGVLREEAAAYEGVEVGIAPSAQAEIADAARGRAKRVVVAGLDKNADVKPDRWEIGADGLGLIEIERVSVQPPVRGLHNLRNAMLSFAAAPDSPVSIVRVTAREDELGVTERELAGMQTQLQRILGEQKHLADLGLAVSKINHDMRNILASAQLISDL